MGSAYNTTDLTVSRSCVCPARDLKADFSACYRSSSLYQHNTNTPKQSWVSPEQHFGEIRGCQWTCCSCSPSRRVCQGQTVCGKQCLQQRGFQPEHLGCAVTQLIWYFPTWSASYPGQQDRDAAETSFFQRITPGSGEVCNFWQSLDGLRKGKRNLSAPLPHCSHARPSHNIALNKKAQMCPVGT